MASIGTNAAATAQLASSSQGPMYGDRAPTHSPTSTVTSVALARTVRVDGRSPAQCSSSGMVNSSTTRR